MVTGLRRLLPANGDVTIHPSVIAQQIPRWAQELEVPRPQVDLPADRLDEPRQDLLLKAPQQSAPGILQESPLAPSLP